MQVARDVSVAGAKRSRLSRVPAALWCVLAFALTLAPTAAAQSPSAPRLVRLQVVGVQTVRPEQVIAWSGLQIDQPISGESIASAIRALYAQGKFRDVFVYEVPRSDGIELLFNLTEYPRLSQVVFEGNDKLKKVDLEETIELPTGGFLSPAATRRAVDSIRAKYRAEGYYNATVEVDPSLFEQRGSLPLVFQIVEGKKVRVRRFVFEGVDKLTVDDLRGEMSTKTDNWYRSGTFKAPEFEEDLEKIGQKYRDEGYLDARIVEHEIVFLEDDENHVEIRISVEEGERYTAGTVSFQGNEVHDEAVLAQLVTLRENDVFREKDLIESRNNIQTLYWDGGYIYSVVSPQRNLRPDRTVDVQFLVREGDQARVRQIRIDGNNKTREAVIRRELRVLPGDLFSNTELRNSQADLFRLGFFNNVVPDFEQTPEPDEIDLVFEVEEKQTGQFTMGVGFSQQTQASGFFNIGENNLFGRGQSLQFAWQFGSRRSFLNLSFTEPWFLGTPTLVGVDLYDRFSNAIQDYYDTRVRGFGVRVGRPIPGARYTRASLRYAYNQTTLRNFDPFYIETLDRLERELGAEGVEFQRLDQTQWPQVESGITTSLRRNSTDNPFFPTRGSDANLRHEINGGLFGGDLDYQRILVDYDWYLSLPGKLAFHVGASSGHLMAYGNTEQVPDYVRFRLGGNRFYKLRGYGDLDIVPRGNPTFVGGRFYTTFTTELAYPITRAVAVLGFVDQGDTWNSFDEADLTNLRTGAGFGVRLEVPLVGRIGLDYGYGFDQTDPGWELHFNFGQFF